MSAATAVAVASLVVLTACTALTPGPPTTARFLTGPDRLTPQVCNGNPSAMITASPNSGPAPLSVVFSSSISGGCPPYQTQWQFGDGTDGGGANQTHVYQGAGVYRVLLEVGDSLQHDAEARTAVGVTGGAGPLMVHVDVSPGQGPAPLDATFWANVTGANVSDGFTTDWSFGDGGWGSGDPVRHLYSAPGNFTAVASVQAGGGASGSGQAPVRVLPAGPSGSPTLSVRATPASGNAPLDVVTTLTSNGAAQHTSLEVCYGDTNVCDVVATDWSGHSAVTATHTFAAAGNFSIDAILLAPNQSVLVGATTSVLVTLAPPLQVQATGAPDSGAAPVTVTFVATVSGGTAPYSLQWDFGDGAVGSTVAGDSVAHTYEQAGTFLPHLSLADRAGHQWSGSLAPVTVASPTVGGLPGSVAGLPTLDVLTLIIAAVLTAGFVLGRYSVRGSRDRLLKREGEALVRDMEQQK